MSLFDTSYRRCRLCMSCKTGLIVASFLILAFHIMQELALLRLLRTSTWHTYMVVCGVHIN